MANQEKAKKGKVNANALLGFKDEKEEEEK
jgi:hypothetical protein